jgi:hypothetical protein
VAVTFWRSPIRQKKEIPESTMTLPACEQRALDRIEETLQAGDPRLRSLFMIFTRLTRYEAMPRTEQVSARLWRSLMRTIAIPVALAAILSGLMLSSLAPVRNACVTQARSHGQSSSPMSGCLSGPAMTQARLLYAR